MKKSALFLFLFSGTIIFFSACEDPVENPDATLHEAFAAFDQDHFTIYLDGDEVVMETDGLPNHTSPYWSNTTARSATMGNMTLETPAAAENHPLFVEPTVTTYA